MIVGNARKAKFTNAEWNPISGMKDLNRKSPPASEKLINLDRDRLIKHFISKIT